MKTKTAIVLTQHVPADSVERKFFTRSIVLPVTRIAKAEPAEAAIGWTNTPRLKLTLRTPEEYLYVGESVDELAAKMNGEG